MIGGFPINFGLIEQSSKVEVCAWIGYRGIKITYTYTPYSFRPESRLQARPAILRQLPDYADFVELHHPFPSEYRLKKKKNSGSKHFNCNMLYARQRYPVGSVAAHRNTTTKATKRSPSCLHSGPHILSG